MHAWWPLLRGVFDAAFSLNQINGNHPVDIKRFNDSQGLLGMPLPVTRQIENAC